MLNRILFIGLGGAGQRQLRLFRENLPNVDLIAYRSANKTPLLNSDFLLIRMSQSKMFIKSRSTIILKRY